MSEVPQLLSIPEAAKALSVSEATLRDWRIHRRNLAFVKLGDALRVDVREIERYIADHTERPVAKTVATAAECEVLDGASRSLKVVDFQR